MDSASSPLSAMDSVLVDIVSSTRPTYLPTGRRITRVKSHREYMVRVRTNVSTTTIGRRYSEFAALEAKLRPTMPSLPKMPPKGILKKLSQSFMDQREYDLGELLKEMVVQDPLLNNSELRAFLGDPEMKQQPEAEAPTLLQQRRPKWLPQAAASTEKCARPEFLDDHQLEVKIATNVDEVVSRQTKSTPNFSGMWVVKRVEGDMEALLKELGLPWVARKAAASAGYGVGKGKARIEQSAIEVKVENINPFKTFTRVFQPDGLPHMEELDGKGVKTLARWEGDALVAESVGVKPVRTFPKVLRYLCSEGMAVEQVLSDGRSVKQIFEYQSAVPEQNPSASIAEPAALSDGADAASSEAETRGQANSTAPDLLGTITSPTAESMVHSEDAHTATPDFSGMWTLMRLDGDMDHFMKAMDVPWIGRKAAKAANYGIGKTKSLIKQSEGLFELESINPIKSFKRSFKIDGLAHEEEVDGKIVKTTLYWEGDTLVTESEGIKPVKSFPTSRRYVRGQEMVVEQILSDGTSVKYHLSYAPLPAQ